MTDLARAYLASSQAGHAEAVRLAAEVSRLQLRVASLESEVLALEMHNDDLMAELRANA